MDSDDFLEDLLDQTADSEDDSRRSSRGSRRRGGQESRSSSRDRRRARRAARKNRKSGDSDYLKEFENDLFGDLNDSSPVSGGDSFLSELDMDSGGSSSDDLDALSDIISEAKRQVNEEPQRKSARPSPARADLSDVGDVPDEADLSASVGDVPLMDEDGDNVDLMDLIEDGGEDGDLSDIRDLLNADESDSELAESRDSFEAAAAGAEAGGSGAEAPEGEEDSEEAPKKNPIAGIIGAITGIFKKKDEDSEGGSDGKKPKKEKKKKKSFLFGSDEEEEVEEEEEPEDDKPEETPEEKKARKKAEKEEKAKKKKEEADAKKKEKEAAKKEKEAKKKEKKAAAAKAKAKAKKSKKKSPKIPLKGIIVVTLFGMSLMALAEVGSNAVVQRYNISRAKDNYDKENYIEAYRNLAGSELSGEDAVLEDRARSLAYLQMKKNQYDCCLKLGKNQMALDSLICGIYFFDRNKKAANKLGITELYEAHGRELEKELKESFDLTPEDAINIYKLQNRKMYTARLQEILKSVGMEVDT